MEFYLGIIFRSIIVYLFIIFAIRLFGKKELTQLSIIDLVFILLISNAVQSAMVGENTTLFGGLLAATSLFSVNWILKNIIFHLPKISRLIQGNPIMLVYHGKILNKHLTNAKISREEIDAAIREHGVRNIKEVDLAVLEIDGNISVLSNNFKKITSKRRRTHKQLSPIS